jgi:glycosyltransferase involved in cell wall biosynthesis
LSANKDIGTVVISGEPFQLFKIGYLAKKKNKIDWIADYRDDWSTSEVEIRKSGGGVRKFLFWFEGKFEKKWVRSAKVITSVSEIYTRRISDYLGIKGVTVENGFEENLLDLPVIPNFPEFTLVFSGTLYPSQDISILLEALNSLIRKGYILKLIFLGTGFDEKEINRISSLVPNSLRAYVTVTQRVPREEALEILRRAHVLINIAHRGLTGIPSSKLYEYVGLSKPILLIPGDSDIMEKIVDEVGLGWVANSPEQGVDQLIKLMTYYENPAEFDKIMFDSKKKALNFGRFQQLTKLTEYLD